MRKSGSSANKFRKCVALRTNFFAILQIRFFYTFQKIHVYKKDVLKCIIEKIGFAKSHKNWSSRQGKILRIFTSPIKSKSLVFDYDGNWSDVGLVNLSEELQLYSSYEKIIF